MNFLNTWALAIGAMAIVAPLAVHFLTRPKPIAMPLSTVRFLSEIMEQRRARSRLRDWLVLLLRAACIALLAGGLARPLMDRGPVVSTETQGATARVIVLDISQSMRAGSGGVTSWTQAQASALQYLETGQQAEVGVVFCGASPRSVFDQLSQNISAIREAVRQAEPVAERAEPRAAMELAARLLGESQADRKELVIVSDFQRSNWGTLPLDRIPADTQIQFHATESSDGGNVAITAVRFQSNPVVGQPAIVEVDIANWSDAEAAVRCRLNLGRYALQLDGKLEPQSGQTLSGSLLFDEGGWLHGRAELESNLDALPDDDQRPCTVFVRPNIRMALLSRQNAQEIPSSSFYLQNALQIAWPVTMQASSPQENSPAAEDGSNKLAAGLQRLHPQRDPVRNWPDCDVLVIDHPGGLDDEALKAIATLLKRGKGCFYVASELVDASNLQRLGALLGAEFQPPVELLPMAGDAQRRDLFVRAVDDRDVPFQVLGSNPVNALGNVRFAGGLATRTTTEGLRDQVKAELSDNSALLYVTSVGAGELAVLNADLGGSNWAVQPTFLPVLSELVRGLVDRQGQRDQAPAGETLVRLLPPVFTVAEDLRGETVEGTPPSDGGYGAWEFSSSQGAMVWNWPAASGAGIYALREGDTTAWMVATATPAIEADLKTLDGEVLTERIGQDRTVGYTTTREQEGGQQDSTWSWLIVACTLGLIGEVILLRYNRM